MATSGILAQMSVVLGAEISGFQRSLAIAKKELSGFVRAGEALQGVGESLSKYVSLPLAAIGAGALKMGSDFESGMNRVEAATLASGKELDDLKNKAKSIALDPRLKFSAQDAAGALEALAKNGVSTTDILGGAADAAVNLATATGGKLAGSADIATDVMNNFGKSAKDLAAVVDNITGTTIASKFSIDDYAAALGQAGGVAGPLGVKFEDFNTAIAATSSGFSSGSDAGTSFKTFLSRLVPASREAEEAMKKLGLQFFDAQGQMKPLRIIAGDLQKAFQGLNEQQRTDLGTKIFGTDSIRTALLLAKQGTEGFDKMAEAIGKVKAASQGEILSKGFAGALEAAKSALEGLGIAIAESGIQKIGTSLLQSFTGVITGLAQTSPQILQFGVLLAGISASIGPVVAAIGALGAALPAIATGFALLSGPIGLIALGLTALAVATAGYLATQGSSTQSFKDQKAAVEALEKGVNPLLARYDQLKSKTSLSKSEQEELRRVIKQIADQVPGVATAFDSYGNALDINSAKARAFVEEQKAVLRVRNKQDIQDQTTALRNLATQIVKTTQLLQSASPNGEIFVEETSLRKVGEGYENVTTRRKLDNAEISALRANLQRLNQDYNDQNANLRSLKGEVLSVADANAKASSISPLTPGVDEAAAARAKALEDLRIALSLNDNLSRALGLNYDYLGGRQSALEAGVRSLVAAGFDPASQTVQRYVSELKKLQDIYTDVSSLQLKAIKLDTSSLSEAMTLPPVSLDALNLSIDEAGGAYARLGSIQLEALDTMAAANVEMERLLSELKGAFADLAIGAAANLGQVAAGVGNVNDALNATLQDTLALMADFLLKFGKQLLLKGAGDIAIGNVGQGVAEIAAGLALGAAGGYAQGQRTKLQAKTDTPRVTGPSAGYTPRTRGSLETTATGGPVTVIHEVKVVQRGADLIGTLTIAQTRQGLTSGR
ncbi:phage tail tape measure protein [Hymenobacter sp. BT175]|uniref:phage tail tape measure protein n=1 Tax=Hymenobacter translucens TaxID=2886507 RepID=UPI001D0F357C|nr:phage tail tape measure protein [Hymenobacter translucens]MCC2547720.1 phage tail tape measure protein [Hymenobacter translucens]